MNSTELALGQAFFWVCAVVTVVSALLTVSAKNPIRGAMGLLLMILSIAGLFLALHAQFLAAIQLIVYAGAIVVLFLFVIMLLGPSATGAHDNRGRIPRAIGGGLFGAAGIGAIALLVKSAPAAAHATKFLPDTPSDFGGVDTFGRLIFSQALVPFELSSALLMVAIVGAVAVARGRTKADLEHRTAGTASEEAEATATPAGVKTTESHS